MEGLSTETCSVDSSRQTNYIQLLSLADGDSITQPAFIGLSNYGSATSFFKTNGSLPKPASLESNNEQQQVLLAAYNMGQGAYSIISDGAIGSSAGQAPVASYSNGVIPASISSPSFDTEAQLEAPVIDRLPPSIMMTPPRSPVQIHLNSIEENQTATKRNETGLSPSERGGWPKGKKRKKNHPRLGKPVPPKTGYVIYSKERRPLLKIENPELSNAELIKLIGGQWSTLSKLEKQKYAQLAALDLERYKKDLAEYQHSPEYQEFLKEKRQQKRQQRLADAGQIQNPLSANHAEATEQNAPCVQRVVHPQENSLTSDETTATVDSGGLFCSDCNIYFFSDHNKSEHLRSMKHRRRTLGEFEKYLSAVPSYPSETVAGTSFTSPTDFAPSSSTVTVESLPDPVNISEFILQYVGKDAEREAEIASLKKSVETTSAAVAQQRILTSQYMDQFAKLTEEKARIEHQRHIWEQQLTNLQAIPVLFETEDFMG